MLKAKHIKALNRFALQYGCTWKRRLRAAWAEEKCFPARTTPGDARLLTELQSLMREDDVMAFKPSPTGYKDIAFLTKAHEERFNTKRAWLATAWRLVTHKGTDMVQPWFRTKTDARELAAHLGIFLIEPAK